MSSLSLFPTAYQELYYELCSLKTKPFKTLSTVFCDSGFHVWSCILETKILIAKGNGMCTDKTQ